MLILCVTLMLLFSTSFYHVKCEDDKYLITLVYRFVFANEALCGDPFADPEWLPAAADCFVDCDPTVYMCMVHMATNIQKCKLFSKDCQLGIRKHLGWSSSVVRVYRPNPSSDSASHRSTNSVIDSSVQNSNVGSISQKVGQSSTVGKAKNMEKVLLGLSSIPESSVNQKSGDASLMVDVMRSSARREWLEAPQIEENGYSIEDTSRFITETPPKDYSVLSEADIQYEKESSNRFRSSVDDGESPRRELLLHKADRAPLIFEYELPRPLSPLPPFPRVSEQQPPAPQPPAPQPSPPSFPPFYLITTSAEQSTRDVMVPGSHNRNSLPKVIDVLEPPEPMQGLEPSVSETVARPPGFRPFYYDCRNNSSAKTSGDTHTMSYVPEDLVATAADNPSIQPYVQKKMVPYSEGIGFSEAPAGYEFSGIVSNGAARFEIEKGIAPLHSSVNVDLLDKNIAVPPEKHIEHFIDPTSMREVAAEVQPDSARDYSSRCCEWSLNGLCDRHWQRVRKICPKSCGSLICEDNEGIKSCTRIVDVDVEDCFQTDRLTRYFGLKVAETAEEKRSIIDGIVQRKLNHINRKKRKLRKGQL